MAKDKVRVRFAPSPTGPLHLGGLRTALFNYLFAKRRRGTFVLRIDDTDLERSSEEYIGLITRGLKWAGLDWDEGEQKGGELGPYRQSERFEVYRKYADQLLEAGKAYRCFCTDEELNLRKQAQVQRGLPPRYDGRCRNLSESETAEFRAQGRKPCVRLRWDPEPSVVEDLIHGQVKFGADAHGDFVLIKTDSTPTYNFATAIDDALLQITHVIRGEDHLSNTPRQIKIAQLLDLPSPQYAHLPLVVSPGGKKLSKRWSDFSTDKLIDGGYLPLAVVNFLARLGWAPRDLDELAGMDKLVEVFYIDQVSSSPSVFDDKALERLNARAIRALAPGELEKIAAPYLHDLGLDNPEKRLAALAIVRDEIHALADLPEALAFLKPPDSGKAAKNVEPDALKAILESIRNSEPKSAADWEGAIAMAAATAGQGGASRLMMQLRFAVTGRKQGPPIVQLLNLLGMNEVISRIENILNSE